VSSPPFDLSGVASPLADIATPYHASFSLSQDDLTASVLSSGNVSSRRLPSRAKTEALNSHRDRWPPSSDRSSPTLHYYKKFISTLVTLPTTQLCLYFTSFLARAPCHRNSTHCHHSLSSSSHAHHPSAQ
jgi:hypothetical protein